MYLLNFYHLQLILLPYKSDNQSIKEFNILFHSNPGPLLELIDNSIRWLMVNENRFIDIFVIRRLICISDACLLFLPSHLFQILNTRLIIQLPLVIRNLEHFCLLSPIRHLFNISSYSHYKSILLLVNRGLSKSNHLLLLPQLNLIINVVGETWLWDVISKLHITPKYICCLLLVGFVSTNHVWVVVLIVITLKEMLGIVQDYVLCGMLEDLLAKHIDLNITKERILGCIEFFRQRLLVKVGFKMFLCQLLCLWILINLILWDVVDKPWSVHIES